LTEAERKRLAEIKEAYVKDYAIGRVSIGWLCEMVERTDRKVAMPRTEYIKARNLANLGCALHALRDVSPEHSNIPESEFTKILGQLKQWQMDAYDNIEVVGEEDEDTPREGEGSE